MYLKEVPKNLCIQQNYLSRTKANQQLTSYLMVKDWLTDWLLPFEIKNINKKKSLLLPLLFNIVLQVHGRSVRQENKIKDTQIENEVRISLFAHGMILCITNPKECTKKLLEVTSWSDFKLQDQFTRISCISIYLEWTIWK